MFGKNQKTIPVWSPPMLYALPANQASLNELIDSNQITAVYDQIHLAIEELYDIRFPAQKDNKNQKELDKFTENFGNGNTDSYGTWVFYPWSGVLVHFPTREHLRALRTSRNRNLVTAQEQQTLYRGTIAVMGLSVGSNIVEALLSGGIGGTYIIVDMDVLEPSNLNRIRAPYKEMGVHKVDYVAKKISEIDPYIKQIHYCSGLDEQNLEEIITIHKPDILIDEMDSVAIKLKLRYRAREAKIPVLMAADNGDGVLLDIERYDLKEGLPILHGNIPKDVTDRIMTDPDIPRAELGQLIGRYFVGFENVPLRMFQSLGEVGKTLPSWPQVGGAAALAGVTIAYCAKKILLGLLLNDGRYLVGPDAQLNPEIKTTEYREQLEFFLNMAKVDKK